MNKLIIIGNLTKDPETRTTAAGKSVCNFTVAVNRKQKKPDGTSEADFFRVGAWGKTGEACQQYLNKGKKVCVTGTVSADCFTGQDGTARAQMNVFAEDVEFLSPRDGTAQDVPPAGAPVPDVSGGQPMPVDMDELPF